MTLPKLSVVIEPTAPEPIIAATFADTPDVKLRICSPAANLNLIVFAEIRSEYSGLIFKISAVLFAVVLASIITAFATPF